MRRTRRLPPCSQDGASSALAQGAVDSAYDRYLRAEAEQEWWEARIAALWPRRRDAVVRRDVRRAVLVTRALRAYADGLMSHVRELRTCPMCGARGADECIFGGRP